MKKFTIREKYVPRWKRRIEGDIKRLRREENFMERGQRGKIEAKKKGQLKDLEEKYGVKRKGFRTVIEELKQRMIAKSAKVQRYEQRITQSKQNRLFHIDQKKLYSELNGGRKLSNNVPDADESRRFWNDIWSVKKEHNRKAAWLRCLQNERNRDHFQAPVKFSIENVRKPCQKIPNWKAPGKDGVQGYWIKYLTSLHMRIVYQLNRILDFEDDLPSWMTYGRTVLSKKDPGKGNAVENYRPITCLPMMWKLLS